MFVILLIVSDIMVSMISMFCQLNVSGSKFFIRMCSVIVNVVIFGVLVISSVMVVGEFWYMFGIYMWNGVMFSLKFRLVMMNIMLNMRIVLLILLFLMVLNILFSFSELVVLYSIDILQSSRFDVSVFRMKYFMVDLDDMFEW